MAAEEEHKPHDEQQEPKIPVFTVLKNGAILKNIFIVNNTSSSNSSSSSQLNPLMANQEEILIIGRHPDCSVMLTHPSISRFHLKIISNPSLQKLSIIDLSSVHGTWVSEKKIEPWERVELSEGDSLRIGGSSRVYRLHWIPLAEAYDFETSYVSPLEDEKEDETFVEAFQDENSFRIENEPVEEEETMIETVQVEDNEDENSFPIENEPVEEEETMIEMVQVEENEDEDSFPNENEQVEEEETTMEKALEEENEDGDYLFKENNKTQSPDAVVECTSSLYTESLQVTVKEIPSEHLLPESPVYLLFDENEEFSESPPKDAGEEKELDYDDGTLRDESEYLVYPTEEFSTLVSVCGNNIPKLESSFVTDIMCGQQSPVISAGGAEKEESYRTFGAECENLNTRIEEVVSDTLVSACDDYIHCYEPSFLTHFTCERQSPVEENEDDNSFQNENEQVEEVEPAMQMAQEEENEDDDYWFKENNETQSLDKVVECTSSLYTASLQVNEIQSAHLIPESPVYLRFDENQEFSESLRKDVGEAKEIDYDDGTLAESENPSFPIEEFISGTLVSAFADNDPSLESSFVTDIKYGQQSPVIPAEEAEKESYRIFGAESENLNSQPEEVVLDTLVSASDNYIHCYEPSFATHFTYERQSPVIPAERTESDDYSHLIDHLDSSFSEGTTVNQAPLGENKDTEESSFLASNLIGETERENEHHDVKDRTPEDLCVVKSLSHDRRQEISVVERQPSLLVEFNSAYSGNISSFRRLEETLDQNEYAKDHHQRDVLFEHSPPCIEESVNSSFTATEVAPEIEDEKENQTPQSVFAAAELPNSENIEYSSARLDKKPSFGSIWSRRGKPANAIQLRTDRNKKETMMADVDSEEPILKENFSHLNEEDQEIFTPDKENFTPNTLLVKSLKKKSKPADINHLRTGNEEKSVTKENFSCLSEDEEEIFPSDKENFTPNTFLLKSLKKKGILESKSSKPSRFSPLKATRSPNVHAEEDLTASPAKENRPLRALQELKPVKRLPSGNQARLKREVLVNKRSQERVPFQSLAVNPVGKAKSEALGTTSTTRSSLSVNCACTVEKNITNQHTNNSARVSKRTWTMVADITTLLNRESRNKLRLLQGLKGTRLIIPRMVIRELDCLRRRGSLFRRKTEACLVLEWIEQCMVETTSWIHVQSSAEDTRLTAPTPPASPHSPFSQGSGRFSYGTTSSLPFLRLGSLKEIVSPTTEDHILECALLCRKVKSDGQVVLLSSDITLKVEAMAEGLICETVQEFRESLINPFSERFLWADSSPRGQTWSVMDDLVLRERYNRCPLKKSLKGESAKGLKLILLHNSHYGQRTPIS